MTHDTLINVIRLIRPNANWILKQDPGTNLQVLVWQDENQTEPTLEEIQAGELALNKLTYIQKRRNEYPSIGDQLDAIWKGGDEALEMKRKIDDVKSKYPKQ